MKDTAETPQTGNLNCKDNVCVLSGVIEEDTLLTADNQYILSGGVFIGNDIDPVTLTIEPGTTLYGESATDGFLSIRRNAQIIAEGTAEAPIVFTSSKEPGSRARGDWGGLIINGNAPINACADDGADFVKPSVRAVQDSMAEQIPKTAAACSNMFVLSLREP